MKSLQTIGSGVRRVARAALSRQGLIVLSVAFAAVLLVPGAATNKKAIAGLNGCQESYVCFYRDVNFGGSRKDFPFTTTNVCYELTGTADNSASSIRTYSFEGSAVYFYPDHGCSGAHYLTTLAYDGGYSWVGSSYNDTFSSFEIFN